ncbi:MAG: hypothetical protein WCH01_22820 [Methylococcaceae bacterium]
MAVRQSVDHGKAIYLPRLQTPSILPPCFTQTEPGPQSVLNEQVLPYVPLRSSGAWTG